MKPFKSYAPVWFRALGMVCTFSLQEDYRHAPQVFDEVLELAVTSLDYAARNGVMLLNGQRLFPIPIGHKGDWSYLAPGCKLHV